jgi:hypothetical protein
MTSFFIIVVTRVLSNIREVVESNNPAPILLINHCLRLNFLLIKVDYLT